MYAILRHIANWLMGRKKGPPQPRIVRKKKDELIPDEIIQSLMSQAFRNLSQSGNYTKPIGYIDDYQLRAEIMAEFMSLHDYQMSVKEVVKAHKLTAVYSEMLKQGKFI